MNKLLFEILLKQLFRSADFFTFGLGFNNFKIKLVMLNCPQNCNRQHQIIKRVNGIDIYECKICSHRFIKIEDCKKHIEENYDDKYFFSGRTGGYPNYYDESGLLYNRGRKYAQILKKEGIKVGKLLDVGAAAGFILKGFIHEGWDGIGIEPNRTMVNYANNQLKLKIYQSTLEEFEAKEPFDCILLIQVIAHFYELDKAVLKLYSMVKENGIILIETWNRNSITAKLQGWNWHEYSPPTIVNWFTKKELIKYFKDSGFNLIRSGRMLKKINSRHAKALLREKISNKLINKIIQLIPDHLNLIYPSEDLFYLILKKTNKLSI
jgi:2-polyprenyl-3-methyl-5-hydroxy-6-metoxy-1,4-benzoquinol methylase